jgi:hypothetical protein
VVEAFKVLAERLQAWVDAMPPETREVFDALVEAQRTALEPDTEV